MLLWSLLHLAGVRAVNPDYEVLGAARGHARRHPPVPAARPRARTPGVPPRVRRGDDDRPLGRASPRRSAWRSRRSGWPRATTCRNSPCSTTTSTRCGDGCLEGVGAEAASLAGHLQLDNLCWLWDNNHVTIEGSTQIAFTEDVVARFLAYQWNVVTVGDANDVARIEHALAEFRATKGRPTLIVLDTHIGYGSPHRQDTAAAHGELLGAEEAKLTWARLRLAGGRAVPGARRRARVLRRAGIGARRACAASGTRSSPPTARTSGAGRRDRTDAAARPARRLGPRPAGVSSPT